MTKTSIKIYTDGSCHTQLLYGAWAAIIFINGKKTILHGEESDTTHNRMELQAVIKAVEFVEENGFGREEIQVCSDSQYVVNLLTRKEKLKHKKFITNKGTSIQNVDLVKRLIDQIEHFDLYFTKIKAHQKDGDEINREVDLIVRKQVRKLVLNHD